VEEKEAWGVGTMGKRNQWRVCKGESDVDFADEDRREWERA